MNGCKTKFLAFSMALMSMTSFKVMASDAAGLEIFYRHIQDSTYEFTVTFYRNCFSIPAGSAFTVYYNSASTSQSGNFTCSVLPVSGTGVPPLVPPNLYNCTGAASSLCNEEYVFRGNWTSPGRANDWIFHTSRCCRGGYANTTSNIQYVQCGLNNLDFPDGTAKNWSPFWHNRRPNHPGYLTDTVINYLFRTVCMDNYYTLDMSVKEYQGDSVSYEFFWPQGVNGTPVTYSSPWSFTNPFPLASNSPPLAINPITGIIPIIPGAPISGPRYILGIEAKEWRNDTIFSGGIYRVVPRQIGFVRRDMTIWIDDTTTCRHDSVHPKDITLSAGGDTVLNVFFHTGVLGHPNSQVRCETLSPDGSEFRILDYSNYVAPYDTTIRSIGVNRAVWQCNAGVTPKVVLHLAEPLLCQDYILMLKTGTDLDVIESECGFLEPEYRTATITITNNVSVNIDTNYAYLTYCLPTENPFPKLTASSQDTTSLEYYWSFEGDTLAGQNVPYVYGEKAGEYKVHVKDEFNCTGTDKITIFHDTIPEFVLDIPPYCDRYGESASLPDAIWVPEDSSVISWEWIRNTLGTISTHDTLKKPDLVEGEWYRLKGSKNKIHPFADKSCSYEYEFYFDRDSFPPIDPLWVKFGEDEIKICSNEEDSAWLNLWEDGISKKYSPWNIQWYLNDKELVGSDLNYLATKEGTYVVFIEDTLGCWGSDTILFTKDERLEGPEIFCDIINGKAYYSFNWTNDFDILGNEVSLDQGKTWSTSSNGNLHAVNNADELKSIFGRGITEGTCVYTEMSISEECPEVVSPPNVITPNGDGLNDVFEIKGLEYFEPNKLKIVDRWGNVVFETDDYKNNWDGGDQVSGVYFYVLSVGDSDGTEHRGTLTLLR